MTMEPLDISRLSPEVQRILKMSGFPAFYASIESQADSDIKAYIKELQNSTSHLLRSNEDMEAARDAETDATTKEEYLSYIQDNLNVIEANNFRINFMEDVLKYRHAGSQACQVSIDKNAAQTKPSTLEDDNGVYL